jgi:Fe-S-cluster containining protein
LSITGKLNSEFYEKYLFQKQDIFSRLEQEVLRQTQLNGETITCQKGCAGCCAVYVEASQSECKAIVYYLYQNKDILDSFLKRYTEWRDKMRPFSDRCSKAITHTRNKQPSETTYRELADALLFYKLQNAACPFLNDSTCSIYSARPFVCAAHFAVTPPEWCSPRDFRNPKVYKGNINDKTANLSSNNEYEKASLTLMPLEIYKILHDDSEQRKDS